MSSSALLIRPTAPRRITGLRLSCIACFGEMGDDSETGLYCSACACHRCGEDATASTAVDGYCEACAAVLDADGFFG